MKVSDAKIHGLKIIQPHVFGDERGFFYESFNHSKFEDSVGCSVNFVQDNHSRSARGVLRGLHYQLQPHQQGKLVRCTQGEVFDVVVDIRKNSPTYGQSEGIILSDTNKLQLWIPGGLAHGFLVISECADFLYKTTDYWFPSLERSLRWNDPHLAIEWPIVDNLTISDKDKNGSDFFSLEY